MSKTSDGQLGQRGQERLGERSVGREPSGRGVGREPSGRSGQRMRREKKGQRGQRVTVLWFPDWPVYAASRAEGWDVLQPAAVIAEHRVVACNASARKAGVRAGMKQRHALAACPVLNVAAEDPAQQAAVHEELLVELESVAAHIETVRAGLLAFPMHALAKFYGDEDRAVELLLNATARAEVDCLAGTADDLVTATWAARSGKCVEPGKSGEFVSDLPIEALCIEPALHGPREMMETLRQLGVATMRDFAALRRSDVAARFGQEAVEWHRIASGQPSREVAPRQVTMPMQVVHEVESPITSTETAAFVARQAAGRLHEELSAAGDVCLRLAVRARINAPAGYTGPTEIERVWRCREPLTEKETAQRVRWQLDGWITRMRGARRTQGVPGPGGYAGREELAGRGGYAGGEELAGRGGYAGCSEYAGNSEPEAIDGFDGDHWDSDGTVGITAIELVPVETVPAGSIMPGLWGGPDEGVRAARAAAGRAQALIGINAVLRPIPCGGRAVAGRVVTVPYGEEDPEEVKALSTRSWCGELLAPLPSVIGAKTARKGADELSAPSARHPATRVMVLDGDGQAVYVTGRGVLSGKPEHLRWGGRNFAITGWAGPWPVDEQWWAAGKRYARMQISTDEPGAFLLVCKGARWRIEATY